MRNFFLMRHKDETGISGTGMVDNLVSYKPAAEFNGIDSFDYCIRDSVGDDESCATVYVEVTPVNDPALK